MEVFWTRQDSHRCVLMLRLGWFACLQGGVAAAGDVGQAGRSVDQGGDRE